METAAKRTPAKKLPLSKVKRLIGNDFLERDGATFVYQKGDRVLDWDKELPSGSAYSEEILSLDGRSDLRSEEQIIVRAHGMAQRLLDSLDIEGNVTLHLSKSDESFTDSKNIQVSSAVFDDRDLDITHRLDVFLGTAEHEGLHCEFTDFGVKVYDEILHSLLNIVEDERIEHMAGEKYPGLANYLKEFKYYYFDKYRRLHRKELDSADTPSRLINAIIALIRYPKALTEGELRDFGPYLVKIHDIMKTFPADTAGALVCARKIYDVIKDALKDELSKPAKGTRSSSSSSDGSGKKEKTSSSGESEEKENEKTNRSKDADEEQDESSETDEDMSDNEESEKSSSGKGHDDAESGKNGSKDDDEEQDESSETDKDMSDDEKSEDASSDKGNDGDDTESGKDESEDETSSSSSDSEDGTSDSDDEDDLDDEDPEERTEPTPAEIDAAIRTIGKILREYAKETDSSGQESSHVHGTPDIDYICRGDRERGEDETVMFIKMKSDVNSESIYRSDLEAVRPYVPAMRNILQANGTTFAYQLRGMRSGRLDADRLAQAYIGSPNVYLQRREVKSDRVAVCVLVDESGSMSCSSKMSSARRAAILLEKALGNLPNVDFFLYGHSADENIYSSDIKTNSKITIRTYRDRTVRDSYVLGHLQARSDNADGYAILETARRVREQTREKVLMFVISDGAPSFRGYSHVNGVAHTRAAVKEVEKMGFMPVQIAIDSVCEPSVMFDHYVKLTDMSTLPSQLGTIIRKAVLQNTARH